MKKVLLALVLSAVLSASVGTFAASVELDGVTWTYSIQKDVSGAQYVQLGDGTKPGCTGANGAVTIPGTIANLPVKKLGASLFHNNTDITSVVIPDSVLFISSSFYGCSNLESVELHDGVYVVADQAFHSCRNLREVKSRGGHRTDSSHYLVAGSPYIGSYAFYDCINLTPPAISHRNTRCVDRAGKYFLEYAA